MPTSKFRSQTSKVNFEVSRHDLLVFTVFCNIGIEVCSKFHQKLRRNYEQTSKSQLRSLFETSSKLRSATSKFMIKTSKANFEVYFYKTMVFTVFHAYGFEVCKKFNLKVLTKFEQTSKLQLRSFLETSSKLRSCSFEVYQKLLRNFEQLSELSQSICLCARAETFFSPLCRVTKRLIYSVSCQN